VKNRRSRSARLIAHTAPLRRLAEVRALSDGRLNTATLNRVARRLDTDCVMVFSFETEQPGFTVHTRMFAAAFGVPEDPATGSITGALGAYLVRHRAIPLTAPTVHIKSEQGMEIGRPSTLFVEVDHTEGEIAAVRVGGQVVLVAEGVVRF